MTDNIYDDDEDPSEVDGGNEPQRMPYPVKVLAFLLGTGAVVTGFASIVNFTSLNRSGHAVALGVAAVASVVAVVGLVLRQRWGSYVAFGMALILALASLQTPGVVIAALAFLGVVMGTLMTRSAKDWLGFA